MPITNVLPGAGNAAPSIVQFDNGNVAMMVYVTDGDGNPPPNATTVTYSPAGGGITNTTAQTIMPAVAGKTNRLQTLAVQNASGVGSEFTVNNGAGGPVLYRGYIGPNGTQNFAVNKSASLGALIEVQMATTGTATYFNATGTVG